jgi:hypothetical protein
LGVGVISTSDQHRRPQNLDIVAKSDANEELERLRKALSEHKQHMMAMTLRAENLQTAILLALKRQSQTVVENPEKQDSTPPR